MILCDGTTTSKKGNDKHDNSNRNEDSRRYRMTAIVTTNKIAESFRKASFNLDSLIDQNDSKGL